jgi:hypothetical protein
VSWIPATDRDPLEDEPPSKSQIDKINEPVAV